MGKVLNKNGKFGRAKQGERSRHWKYGKGSGNGTFRVRKLRKMEKRGKLDGEK